MTRRHPITIFESADLVITRLPNGGRKEPGGIYIYFKRVAGSGPDRPNGNERRQRKLFVTIDELFTLTEELDDICDAIEDEEIRSAPRNRLSDGLLAME